MTELQSNLVLISELGSGTGEDGQDFWNVEVRTKDATTICDLAQLLGTFDHQEFRWYVEDFASNHGSPFETTRGERCHEKLQSLSLNLHFQLGLVSLRSSPDCNLRVDLVAKSLDSSFFKIPWEVLENPSLYRNVSNVSVRRRYAAIGDGGTKTISCDTLNVLIVTARPDVDDDIDYLLISRELVTIAAKLQKPNLPVYIEIVRPGTWAAFQTCLKNAKERENPFHIAHLDLHGIVIEKGPRKGYVRESAVAGC
jgi:hypothetical protein